MTRELSSHEWEDFVAQHSRGDVVTATVTRTLPFGCLVETVEGVRGLLRKAGTPVVGDRVEARIEAIDPDERRVSLVGI
jgi:ribosomal protein S1